MYQLYATGPAIMHQVCLAHDNEARLRQSMSRPKMNVAKMIRTDHLAQSRNGLGLARFISIDHLLVAR